MPDIKPKSVNSLEDFLKRIKQSEVKGSPKCPVCKGDGFTMIEKFTGNDIYDEPKYIQVPRSCTECKETITRIKEKYL